MTTRHDSTGDRSNSATDSPNSMVHRYNSTTSRGNSDSYTISSTIDRGNFDTYSTNSTTDRGIKEPTLRSTAHLQFAQAHPASQKLQKSFVAPP